MSAKPKCIHCGAPATLLCDSALGWERLRGQLAKDAPGLLNAPSHDIPIKYRLLHTCDAQLCSACAVNAGGMHFRLRHHGAFSDTTDYCPGHDRGELRTEITGIQAQAKRAAWKSQVAGKRESAEAGQADLFGG